MSAMDLRNRLQLNRKRGGNMLKFIIFLDWDSLHKRRN